MAQIRDLDKQRQALAEIQSTIKEIEVINTFLGVENESGVYQISFKKEQTGVSVDGENSELVEDKDKKRAKKSKKDESYSAPFLCEDSTVVRKYVLLFKHSQVEKVRDLSEKFNIFLDEEDEKILHMFEEEKGNE